MSAVSSTSDTTWTYIAAHSKQLMKAINYYSGQIIHNIAHVPQSTCQTAGPDLCHPSCHSRRIVHSSDNQPQYSISWDSLWNVIACLEKRVYGEAQLNLLVQCLWGTDHRAEYPFPLTTMCGSGANLTGDHAHAWPWGRGRSRPDMRVLPGFFIAVRARVRL
jgi:hypothetical protein